MPSPVRRPGLWVGIAFALALALVSAWFLWARRSGGAPPVSNTQTAAPAPAAATEAVNDRLRREIAEQGVTVDRARELFVLEVGPLDGVTAPSGLVKPTFSGTYALTQLIRVRSQLTPPQRARLDELLDPRRSTLPPGLPPIGAPFNRAPFAPGIRPASYLADAAEDQYRAYFTPMYEWANRAINTLTGQPLVPGFLLTFESLGKNWALTAAWDSQGKRFRTIYDHFEVNGCQSRIDATKFANQPVDVQLSVVTHEVFHCYQQFSVDSAEEAGRPAGWIHDGEAMWVQMTVVPPATFPALQNHWNEYLSFPKTHLFSRAYDAAGFYGHVADAIDQSLVVQRLIPAFQAAARGDSMAAYSALVSGVEDQVLDTWASSYFRAHESKQLWTARGPGSSNFPAAKLQPQLFTLGADDSAELTFTNPWELSLFSVDTSADIVVVMATEGHVALIDRSEQVNRALSSFQQIALCVRGDCRCPPGSESDAPPPTLPAQAPIDIGLTGGRTGAHGWAHAISTADYCKKKEDPTISRTRPLERPPGGGGGGTSEPESGKASSDPHFVTYDGRYYDVQAIGEFVLTRSTTDDFAVQVRLGRIGSLDAVSITSAMATRVGTDRVTVSIDPPPAPPVPVLRVNGEKPTKDFVRLSRGSVRAIFYDAGTGYSVEFDDGTRVGVGPFARQGLNVWVVPAAARKGKLTGLLGDFDGSAANDPVARGSSAVLSAAPDYDELYGTFANSWRIAAADAAFDYAPGQSTETFTDAAFPNRAAAADAASLAPAQETCRAGGITDAHLLRNCAVDVSATGDARLVRSYRPQQRRMDYFAPATAAPASTLTGTGVVTSTPASMRTKSLVLEGRVTDAGADAFAPFDGFKGDIVYLDPDACQKPRFMQVQGPSGKPIGGTTADCGTRLVLPEDGRYRLALNPFHDFTGPYRVSIVAVRPDRVTTIKAGDVLSGTLGMRAEQDVYLVEMRSPGAITLGGDGCQANFDVTVYYGDAEVVGAGPACRIGQVTLPKAGTYRIVMNPFNNSPGPYRVPTK